MLKYSSGEKPPQFPLSVESDEIRGDGISTNIPEPSPQNPMLWVAHRLDRLGFELYQQESMLGTSHHSINGHPVLIRFARCSPTHSGDRWQWYVPDPPKNATLILVATDREGRHFAYIVPYEVAVTRTNYEIKSHPQRTAGHMLKYFENWPALVEAVQGCA